MVRVTIFERMPVPSGYSIERVFREVLHALPERYSAEVVQCPTPRHSPWWLLKGIARAWAASGEVNHIVGDVHYAALGLPGGRAILTVHDLNRLDDLRGLRKRLYALLYFTLPLRKCRFVTAVSDCTRDRLVELFPFASDKIVVIPDCVPGRFAPKARSFDKDCPRVLQVGTKPNKNLDRVAKALQGERCILHVVGRLDERQLRLLRDLNICFENDSDLSDDEMVLAYGRADLLLFASLAEGFGLPIVEANAVGLPTVTSRLSPMKDVAADAGCLVDPYDAADIRAGVRRVIADDRYRNELIERGYENAKRYSARSVAEQYARLYDRIAVRTGTTEVRDLACRVPK